MLFNSFPFLLGFLPVTLAGGLLLARLGSRNGFVAWLVATSLFFYSYWNPAHLWVMLVSIAANYAFGTAIASSTDPGRRRWLLMAGIALDLTALAYWKYTLFLAELLLGGNAALMADWAQKDLPLGISFFTFTQIAFLVDCHRGGGRYRPVDYVFFVTFFPHLIAGPILHHRDIIPQLTGALQRLRGSNYLARWVVPAIAIFAIGLFKKVILADAFGSMASHAFAVAEHVKLTFLEAWGGALAYTLQIYFDFSAYSDMAVALGLLFGIKLPINFLSPYKARSVIEFWRRWHMTLSRFLRDYLYIALGGNRLGQARRLVNLMVTMLLGGLWHGASLTFVLWGGLHGAMLVVNHLMREHLRVRFPAWLAVPFTLALVTIAWVPFRAPSFDVVLTFWRGMAGDGGLVLPLSYAGVIKAAGPLAELIGLRTGELAAFDGLRQVLGLSLGLAIVWGLPSAMRLMDADFRHRFLASPITGWLSGAAMAVALMGIYLRNETTFLYFQF